MYRLFAFLMAVVVLSHPLRGQATETVDTKV
jgi:hypothetical protein